MINQLKKLEIVKNAFKYLNNFYLFTIIVAILLLLHNRLKLKEKFYENSQSVSELSTSLKKLVRQEKSTEMLSIDSISEAD